MLITELDKRTDVCHKSVKEDRLYQLDADIFLESIEWRQPNAFSKIAVIAALALTIALSSVHGSGMIFAVPTHPDRQRRKGLFSGVVRKITHRGYITLYFEDGSGADPDKFSELITLRSFTYRYDMPVTRDGYPADIGEIKPR